MFNRILACLSLFCILLGTACRAQTAVPPPEASQTENPATAADLSAIKAYTLDNAHQMKAGAADLQETAQRYYDLIASYDFDYDAAWENDADTLTRLVATAKDNWLTASQHYELDEGIIAGVPALAAYDVWIDAGPSAAEAPQEAYEWTLDLPNGRSLHSPGNFFHSLLEPTLWGTNPAFTGLAVDLNGDGAVRLGEALPEANVFLVAAAGLNDATAEMITAVDEWTPTLDDAFTALVVMIPTMNEYFEQWKLSAYITGQDTTENAFIGASRLFDITSILNGLDVTYDNVAVLVQDANPDLHTQIEDGFGDLRGYVDDLYGQEQAGKQFKPAQADLFGSEAQQKATALAGQVSQAAALLNVTIEE